VTNLATEIRRLTNKRTWSWISTRTGEVLLFGIQPQFNLVDLIQNFTGSTPSRQFYTSSTTWCDVLSAPYHPSAPRSSAPGSGKLLTSGPV
jgi:hypothetical protein